MIVIEKLDAEGKEIIRTGISAPPVNLLIGKRTLLGVLGDDLVVVANAQTQPGLVPNSPKSNPLGIGAWCEGTGLTTIYSLNPRSLAYRELTSIKNY